MSERDTELEAAVRTAFERQARSAPEPVGLVEAVRARGRRRRLRDLAVAGVIAVLAVAGALVGLGVVTAGPGDDPGAVAAGSAGPGAFGADQITLCPAYADGRLSQVALSVTDGGEVETEVAESGTDQSVRVLTESTADYTVRLDVLAGSLAEQTLADARAVVAGDRDGRVGDDASTGERVLYVETGIGDSLLRLAVVGSGPDDAQLLAWAAKIVVGDDPGACGG